MDLSKTTQPHTDTADSTTGNITLIDCLYDIDFDDIPDCKSADSIYKRPAAPAPAATVRHAVLPVALVLCVSLFIYAGTNIGYTLYANANHSAVSSEANYLFDIAAGHDIGFEIISMPDNIIPLAGFTDESEQDERQLLLEAENRGRLIYADLLEINPDFLGMIEIPGVIERQPYVMSRDNIDYLIRNFQGQRTGYGTVFLNSGSDRLLMDNHSIFFGHYNSDNEGMFTKLMEYKKASTFESSPIVVLDGLIGKSIWIIFAAHVVEPDLRFMDSYNDTGDYAQYLEYILRNSMFTTDVDVNTSDRIITLSVCDYTYEDSRFLVHARKLRPGEDIPDAVSAAANPN